MIKYILDIDIIYMYRIIYLCAGSKTLGTPRRLPTALWPASMNDCEKYDKLTNQLHRSIQSTAKIWEAMQKTKSG